MRYLPLPSRAPSESGGPAWVTHQPLHALHVGGADGQGFFVPPQGLLKVPTELGNLATHVQHVVGHWEEVGSFLGTGCGFCGLSNANVDFSCGEDRRGRCFPASVPGRGPANGCDSGWGHLFTFPPRESGRGPSGIHRAQSQAIPHPEWKRMQADSLSRPQLHRDLSHSYCGTLKGTCVTTNKRGVRPACVLPHPGHLPLL